jgi:hypothetical protein
MWLSKSILNGKNHRNLCKFFFIEEYQFRSTFFVTPDRKFNNPYYHSDHENQISDKPSKAFEQVEEQPNEEESLKLFLEPDTEPMDADIIPSSQKEDIERSVSETSTPVLAKKLQNLGKNFDMEQLKETLSKKVSTNCFPYFCIF